MIVLLAWPGLVYNTDCCEYFMAKYFSRSNIFTFPANILHVSRQFNSIQLYRHCNVHDIFSIQHTSAQHSPLHIKFYIPLWLPHHSSTPHHSSATLLTQNHIEYRILEKRRRFFLGPAGSCLGFAQPVSCTLWGMATLDSLRSLLSFFYSPRSSLWSPMSIPLVTKVYPFGH